MASLYQFLLAHFSYGVLFVWSIFEGEVGLMLAGFFAHQKHFDFAAVIAVAIVGAVVGDTLLYGTGYFSAPTVRRWLRRYGPKLDTIEAWFRRYGGLVIVFERFVYGTHIPALLLIGMSRYGFLRFLLLDVLGVTMWAVTFTWVGYAFGQTMIDVFALVQRHVSVAVLLMLSGILLYRLHRDAAS